MQKCKNPKNDLIEDGLRGQKVNFPSSNNHFSEITRVAALISKASIIGSIIVSIMSIRFLFHFYLFNILLFTSLIHNPPTTTAFFADEIPENPVDSPVKPHHPHSHHNNKKGDHPNHHPHPHKHLRDPSSSSLIPADLSTTIQTIGALSEQSFIESSHSISPASSSSSQIQYECHKKRSSNMVITDPSYLSIVKDIKVQMTIWEKYLLWKEMNKSKVYLEFGTGGSTIMACMNPNIEKIIAIESSEIWLKQLIGNNSCLSTTKKLIPYYVDIGPTTTW